MLVTNNTIRSLMTSVRLAGVYPVLACAGLAISGCSAAATDGSAEGDTASVSSELRCGAPALATLSSICEDSSTAINPAALGAASAPTIDVGKTYGVHLIAGTGGKGGELSFVAARSGLYTVYLGTPLLPLQIHAEGALGSVSAGCISAIDKDECSPLRRAFAFSLVKGQAYRMVLGPIAPEQWVRLRIEAPSSEGLIVFAAALGGATHTDLYTVEADGTSLTQLTDTPTQDEQFPRWSPDYTRVAYMRDGALVVADRSGENDHVVTTTVGRNGVGITAPAWSPDGTRLVYSYPRAPFVIEDTDESYRTSLHVIHADGTGDTQIPEAPHGFPPGIGTLTEPSWSSTGLIAFRQADDCPDCAGGSSTGIIREDGTGYMQVAPDTFDQPGHDVEWSPDASHWAYTELNPRDGRIGISLPDGTSARTLTSVSSRVPRWSPDASRIAYVAPSGIFVLNADGTGVASSVLDSTTVAGIDW